MGSVLDRPPAASTTTWQIASQHHVTGVGEYPGIPGRIKSDWVGECPRITHDRFGETRVVITDKLRSYFKPIRDLAPGADHRAHKGLNNRIEGAHRPTRKREKQMGRFKLPRQAQRFLAAAGLSRLMQPAKWTPKRFIHFRIVSRLTITPRSARRPSTSAVLSAKRW